MGAHNRCMVPEDFPEGQYRRKDWRRGWVLLFVGALVLVAGLVIPGPDDKVECGGQEMYPGSYCGTSPICTSMNASDCGSSYEDMRSLQADTDSLKLTFKWIIVAVGAMLLTGGVSLLLIGHARRHRLRRAEPGAARARQS